MLLFPFLFPLLVNVRNSSPLGISSRALYSFLSIVSVFDILTRLEIHTGELPHRNGLNTHQDDAQQQSQAQIRLAGQSFEQIT